MRIPVLIYDIRIKFKYGGIKLIYMQSNVCHKPSESKSKERIKHTFTSILRVCKPAAAALTAMFVLSLTTGSLSADGGINTYYNINSPQQTHIKERIEEKKSAYLPIYPLKKASYDSNWSGYISESNFKHPKSVFTSIVGTWKVHSVWKGCDTSPKKSDAHAPLYTSVQWVGISGANGSGHIIQAGTEEDYGNVKTTYSAWYELLPSYSVTIPKSKIDPSPGDIISSRISLIDARKHIWNINVNDYTKNQSFSKTVIYVTPRQSAEWVEEVQDLYYVKNGKATKAPSLLAGFGRDQFVYSGPTQGNYAGVNGHSYAISHLPHRAIDLLEHPTGSGNKQTQEVRAATSKLGLDGKSFDIYYLDCGSMRRP